VTDRPEPTEHRGALGRLIDRLPVQLPEAISARATMELSRRLRWLHRLRMRALAVTVGIGLAAIAAVSFAAAPVWPVVGVAITAVAFAVGSMGSRLSQPTCMACGGDLTGEPPGPHGVICPGCGSINTITPGPNSDDTLV